jgi:hypothetical protein
MCLSVFPFFQNSPQTLLRKETTAKSANPVMAGRSLSQQRLPQAFSTATHLERPFGQTAESTTRRRRLRDATASNPALARSVMARQPPQLPRAARQQQQPSLEQASESVFYRRPGPASTRANVTAGPASLVSPRMTLPPGRNDLQGGSGVGAGSYSFTSRPLPSEQDVEEDDDDDDAEEPTTRHRRSTAAASRTKTKKIAAAKKKRARPSSSGSSSAPGGKRKRSGWGGGARRRGGGRKAGGGKGGKAGSSSFGYNKRNKSRGGGDGVWGPVNDGDWSAPPANTGRSFQHVGGADISF